MKLLHGILAAFSLLFVAGCGSSTTAPAPEAKSAEAPKPARKILDETQKFPSQNRGAVTVVEPNVEGKPYLPAGNVAQYGTGKSAFKAFVIQTDSPTAAAILLNDVRKNLTDAKLVPSFGGYFGTDSGIPYFVFPKGKWLAGVVGLPQDKADAFARQFAARIN
mgnify:CR=1 FL=1